MFSLAAREKDDVREASQSRVTYVLLLRLTDPLVRGNAEALRDRDHLVAGSLDLWNDLGVDLLEGDVVLFVVEEDVRLGIGFRARCVVCETLRDGSSRTRSRDLIPDDRCRVTPVLQDGHVCIADLAVGGSVESGTDTEDLDEGVLDQVELVVELVACQVCRMRMSPGVRGNLVPCCVGRSEGCDDVVVVDAVPVVAVDEEGAGDVVLLEQTEDAGLVGLWPVVKGHGKSAWGRACEELCLCAQEGPESRATLSADDTGTNEKMTRIVLGWQCEGSTKSEMELRHRTMLEPGRRWLGSSDRAGRADRRGPLPYQNKPDRKRSNHVKGFWAGGAEVRALTTIDVSAAERKEEEEWVGSGNRAEGRAARTVWLSGFHEEEFELCMLPIKFVEFAPAAEVVAEAEVDG